MFSPLAHGSLVSKILVATQIDLVTCIIANVIGKKKKTLRFEGFEEDECLKLFNIHTFVPDVKNCEFNGSYWNMSLEVIFYVYNQNRVGMTYHPF